jgi:GntR family transcriptional regulator
VSIDPTADRAVYRQLADLLRARITSGELGPGSRLPAEGALAQEHGISRDSARKAVAVLRAEGLVITDRAGSHVREQGEVTAVAVPAGATITARMPTEQERRAHGIAEGVPVLVVADDGEEAIYPADRHRLTYPPS